MVESIGNEVLLNAEPEHSHGMIGSDVIIMESEVHSKEGEMLIKDASNKTVACSEVDQNIIAEPLDKDVLLSEKSLANDEEEDGKASLEEITKGNNQNFSGCNNMTGIVHDQEFSPVSTGDVGSISADQKNADIETVKVGTMKGNVSCSEHENIDGRSKEIVERNGESQASLNTEADNTSDERTTTNLPTIHEGSVMMAPVAPAISSCITDSALIQDKPTIDSADNIESEQQQHLGYAKVNSSVLQKTEDLGEQMQSNLGKLQENTDGFASSENDLSVPLSIHREDADQQMGQNIVSVGELCEQTSATISSHADVIAATALGQSVENSDWIDTSIGHHAIEVQDYSDDTEMVDSGEVNEEPEQLTPEISQSQSEDDYDDDQIGSVSDLQGKASDSENEPVTDAEKSLHREGRNAKRVASRLGSLTKEYRATYELPPETADEFSVNDLVWGKVKSHPWWPGQIFDPSDSSDKAMKYRRKDCYLVAYFGDKSFAWNEASQLKHFRAHFSQEEKQSSSEAFQNAIDCALEEVSRRVELGLACSCMPEETYDEIKYQIVENAGIQIDSSKKEGGDGYITAESFQPDKLFDYVRSLAQLPTCGANQLELTIAKAQLLSFNRLKGLQLLPEFQFFEGLLENDVDTSLPRVKSSPSESEHPDSVAAADVSCTVKSKGPKRKHNLKDIVYHRRKEKSFSEIMGESLFYYDEDYDSDEKLDGMLNAPTVGRKRKTSNFLDDEPSVPESTRTISLAKVSQAATPSPRQSFKIGDCIRRVAIQLTGSLSTINKPTEDEDKQQVEPDPEKSMDIPEDIGNENLVISTEETSPDDYILELYLTAQDPLKVHGFSKSVVSFFSEFRDAAVSAQRKSLSKDKPSSARGSGRKRKSSLSLGVSPEEFEYHDRKDSYWADMVVENNSEDKVDKQPARRSRKRKDSQLGTEESEKPIKTIQKRRPRKQKVNGNNELCAEQLSADEGKQELPTELILTFGDISSIPSVADLNRIFRRFGPLKLSETEADKQNSRARVVYKNGSDAQIAFSSAATFNIFGSATVHYQLSQTPPVSSHGSTLPLALCAEDTA
ncbi:hypothetical protein V2J09_001301 [Rumex salicifolius]